MFWHLGDTVTKGPANYVLFNVINLIKNHLFKYIKCINTKKLILVKIYGVLITRYL